MTGCNATGKKLHKKNCVNPLIANGITILYLVMGKSSTAGNMYHLEYLNVAFPGKKCTNIDMLMM